MQKKTSNTLIGVVLIAFGWIVGQYVENIAIFTYSYEISILDAIGLVVTMFMAWYVSRVLEKSIHDRRVEKDLVLGKIDEVDQVVERLILLNSLDSDLQHTEVVNLFKKSRKGSARFWNVIEKRYERFSIKEKEKYTQLALKIRNADRLCTYTPPGGGDPDITIRGGLVRYSKARRYEVDLTLESIRDDLMDLKLEINVQ